MFLKSVCRGKRKLSYDIVLEDSSHTNQFGKRVGDRIPISGSAGEKTTKRSRVNTDNDG